MRNISEFEPFVLAYAPYIPSDILQHTLRETVNEFLRETKIAIDTLEIETQEKVPDYIIPMPDCRRLVKVSSVSETQLKCSGRDNWTRLCDNIDNGAYSVELRRGSHPIIVLTEPRRQPTRLRIEYSWTIGRDDCDIPDFVYEDFMDTIVAGALIRLAGLPDNQLLAQQLQLFGQTWFKGIQSAKVERKGGRAQRLISAPILGHRGRSIWR